MCIQDWRVGRLIRSVPGNSVLAPAATLTLPRNSQRVGISFSSFLFSEAVAARNIIAVDGTDTFLLQGSFMHLHLTFATHGDIPIRELVLTAGASGAIIGIVEYFMPEGYLTAALQEFERDYGR